MIPAAAAIRSIGMHRGDALAVTHMTPSRYWEAVSDRPELDLPIYGAMGKASSVALGLALARPDKKVLVLDGDGALLMNLGALVTIAGQAPPNLVHFVFEDGVYQTTGGQPVPGAGVFDLADMARSAGFKESFTYDDQEEFAGELPAIMGMEGPVFVCLKVYHTDELPPFRMGNTRDAMRRLAKVLREG